MATTVTVDEAQTKLRELIHTLVADHEVIITENEQPVAKLVVAVAPAHKFRRPGTLRGTVRYMAPDFDAPLEEFSPQ